MMRPSLSLIASAVALLTTAAPTVQLDQGGIVRGDVSKKQICLIFTGGDYAEGVPTILDLCKRKSLPAHFFVTGEFLRTHADVARAIIAAGQTLGPHGDAHLLYCDWKDRSRTLVTREEFRDDLQKNLDDLKAIGAPPTRYFIPPYEYYNADQVKWANEMGLTLINFTPGSGSNRDYIPEGEPRFSSSDDIVRGILRFESTAEHGLNGFLLLLHCGSRRQDKMHPKLEGLIDALHERGYSFITLDEMIGP